MSVIPGTAGKTASVYAGNHNVTASTESNYLIVNATKRIDDGEETSLSFSSSTEFTTGVLNAGKYTAVTTSDFNVDSTDNPVNVTINSVPKRYAVTYNRNHDASDANNAYRYMDKGDNRAGIDRSDITYSSNTYSYSATAITFVSTSWNAPSNKHFSHWNTERNDSGTTYNESADLSALNNDVVLYAIYANDDTYTINVWFDSDEINGSNVTIS